MSLVKVVYTQNNPL